MRMSIYSALFIGVAAVGCRPAPASTSILSPTDKARNFALEFYGWYTAPNATKNIDTAMALRRASFAPDLAAMVDSDNACAARAQAECNIEEDPILASQDPCQQYEIGGAVPHGDTVAVEVFGVCEGKRDSMPAIIAMVVPKGAGWQFANFVYPVEKTDLRTILSRKQ